MVIVGYVAIVVAAIVVILGALQAVRSIPDLNWYRRIRKM